MKKGKIVIAGGTGFIGQYFAKRFEEEGYEVVHISRKAEHVNWEDRNGMVAALEGADILINLAGRTVDCRYNEKNKQEILLSRTKTTSLLGEALLECKQAPELWLNSSTATIYRHAEDRAMTEADGEIGTGFSVSVAKAWEEMFFSFDLPHTRQVALRIAIVLGSNGGVIAPYLNLVQYGLGGYQGSGKQMFSWIHVEDLFSIVQFVNEHKELSGAVNCAAPNPVTNKELMRGFRKVTQRKFGLPMPKWLLKLGAFMIGTETELVLKSRWVLPERLLNSGFEYKYPLLQKALEDVVPH